MYIDGSDFEKWMERLSQKLNEIGKDLKALMNTTEVLGKDEKLLDNQTCHFCSKCLTVRSNVIVPPVSSRIS
ncbi:hypothetical protein EZS27_042499 [termite gut metagenome]|uniref:Uncharacterized protein n=1 Tax=termite gut metagenome TaxID=433724 RepID=A0A5J4P8R6_9ZZZZ